MRESTLRNRACMHVEDHMKQFSLCNRILLGNLPRRHAAPVVLFLVAYYLFRVFLLTPHWKVLSDSYSQNYRGSELYELKYLLIWSVLFWASAYLPFKNWSLKQKSFRSYRRRIPIFFWVRILTNFISSFKLVKPKWKFRACYANLIVEVVSV
jgi:hypothetical protein